MTVLPYRARRFIRNNLSWNNIRFQWAILGFATFLPAQVLGLIYTGPTFEQPWYVLMFAFVFTLVSAQFFYAIWKHPNPTEYPWAVRKYDDLQRWWNEVSQPARIGTFEGKTVLERWELCDFRSIYDHTGRLVATEQTIDWSYTDPDWRYGDAKEVDIIVTRQPSNGRLPWLARLRSPKLPVERRAAVIDQDGSVLGHTTYSEH